ncbi:ELWxxDGT repeat protein [uncultured Aquimarina sp.]|uniref:ELWxxDGT repeat protein n=1 Tax=uncultured Aquimarina sp. TaxID=575652 RepID=UPI0026180393|nr:ELWxxDGT repeat protein [uncultured Aquimarina sp.]
MRSIFTLLFFSTFCLFGQHAELVKDINSNLNGYAYVEYITEFNGHIYFRADDQTHGEELWVSDGTTAGTRLFADIRPGQNSSSPRDFAELNGKLYFSANGENIGRELWVTDGTPEGTQLVKDIWPGSNSGTAIYITVFNNKIYFRGSDENHGSELWVSDGTAAGTHLVKDITSGTNSSFIRDLMVYNNKMYFAADDGTHGYELWVSDGTEAGTQMVKDIYAGTRGSNISHAQVYNGKLYFKADDGVHGEELWETDGTEMGTKLFIDIKPGASFSSSRPSYLQVFNGSLYFSADNGTNGSELFKSDGTPSGTQLVVDIRPGSNSGSPRELTIYNNKLYFNAEDGINGRELWESDGTAVGTKLTADINPGSDRSEPRDLVVFNNQLFFAADGEKGSQELFVSDGTEAGTKQISFIDQSTSNNSLKDMIAYNNKLFFAARDGINGTELWTSDGTETGTQLLKDIKVGSNSSSCRNLTVYNNKIYFTADDGIHGGELWETDGTEAGTKLAVDILDGSTNADPANLIVFQDNLYFSIYDFATGGSQLYKTDGTKAGTQKVDVFKLTSGTASINEIVVLNDKLYLQGYTPVDGSEIWETDGTDAGSKLAFETAPGNASTYPREITAFNSKLYHVEFHSGSGLELWAYDPATDTNELIKDIFAGPNSSQPNSLYVHNNKLYFRAEDGVHGNELWVSDGTEVGTQLVADIRPGINGSFPGYFETLNDHLYFRANDGIHAAELWETDGTEAGTRMAADIDSRIGSSSNPDFLTALNNRLYLRANDGIHSDELYVFIPYDCSSLPSNKLFVSTTGTDSANGTSWNEATTLKQALKIAQSCPTVEEIWVQEGVYLPGKSKIDTFKIPSNIKLYGGFSGTETNLSERDWVNHQTILSGDIGLPNDNNGNTETIIKIENSENITLDGFIIEDANAALDSNSTRISDNSGGAIFVSNGNNLTVTNCIFRNNQAELGAIIFYANGASMASFTNCLFYDNTATVTDAIYAYNHDLTFTNCTIVNNTIPSGFGVFGTNDGTISLENTIVEGPHNSTILITGTGSLNTTYSYLKGEYPTGTGNIDGTIIIDVLFKDAANNDFTLQGGSALVDQGDNTANNTLKGLGGNYRIIDGDMDMTNTIDIGAYEYSRLSQTITFNPLAEVTYGDADFDLTATCDSGLEVSYSSSDTSVVTVSGNTVTIVGVGTTTITASQAGNTEYLPALDVTQSLKINPRVITVTADENQSKVFGEAEPTLTYSVTTGSLVDGDVLNGNLERTTGENAGFYPINQGTVANANYDINFVANDFEITKADQIITFNNLSDVTYGDADFNLNATVDSGLAIDYTSSDTSVATILGNTVTISGIGTTTITASQAGNANYNAAITIPQTLTVTPRAITITADTGQSKVFGNTEPVLTYTITSGSLVGSDVLSGNLTRNTGEDVGFYEIQQGTVANANYDITFVTNDFEITKADQIITFNNLSDVTYGDADFNLNATADSGLAIDYTSSDTSVATILGNTVTISGIGTTTITASQIGNTNYNTAVDVTQTLTVTPKAITITADSGQGKVFGSADPALTYFVSAGSLVGSDVLTGNITREVGENVGLYAIQQGTLANTNYDITFAANDFEITKADQNITFNALTDVIYGDADFNLNATTSSGLTITYSSSDTNVATVSGNIVTIIGVGTTSITANQAGNENYNVATSVSQSLQVIQRPITVTADAGQSKIFGTADPILTHTITSGNLVASDVLNGNLERTAGEDAGTYPINQGTLDNINYDITFVANDFEITKVDQSITFNALADVIYGDTDFNLNATASSGLTIRYSSSDTNVATVSGNTITIIGAGTTSITAIQEGNENYNFVTVNQTLTVLPKTITVTADTGKSKEYGTADPVFTYIITNGNLVVSDILTGNLERAAGEDVGIYPINQGTLNNSNYNITFKSENFEITKATQVITFNELTNVNFGNPAFDLNATASSGLPITYSSSNTNVVTVSGNTVTIVGEGSVVISAHQPGNENYLSANFVTRILTVLPGEIQEELVKLYPNPVVNEIQIAEIPSNNRLSIYDANGRLVKQIIDYSKDETIHVATLPSGVYLIKIVFLDYRGKTIVKRFVKQ